MFLKENENYKSQIFLDFNLKDDYATDLLKSKTQTINNVKI